MSVAMATAWRGDAISDARERLFRADILAIRKRRPIPHGRPPDCGLDDRSVAATSWLSDASAR
jgi:hypothetical protein